MAADRAQSRLHGTTYWGGKWYKCWTVPLREVHLEQQKACRAAWKGKHILNAFLHQVVIKYRYKCGSSSSLRVSVNYGCPGTFHRKPENYCRLIVNCKETRGKSKTREVGVPDWLQPLAASWNLWLWCGYGVAMVWLWCCYGDKVQTQV